MARKLPADRLPKATRNELRLLLVRCRELERARVHLPRYGLQALARTIAYLDAHGETPNAP